MIHGWKFCRLSATLPNFSQWHEIWQTFLRYNVSIHLSICDQLMQLRPSDEGLVLYQSQEIFYSYRSWRTIFFLCELNSHTNNKCFRICCFRSLGSSITTVLSVKQRLLDSWSLIFFYSAAPLWFSCASQGDFPYMMLKFALPHHHQHLRLLKQQKLDNTAKKF